MVLSTNGTLCPTWSKVDTYVIDQAEFWLSGVLTSTLALLGLLSNSVAMLKIRNKLMGQSLGFKILLIGLGLAQNAYLASKFVDTFRKVSDTQS